MHVPDVRTYVHAYKHAYVHTYINEQLKANKLMFYYLKVMLLNYNNLLLLL